MPDPNNYLLCYAQGDSEPTLLLVRRQFIQTRVAGQTVPGIIPDWAGQWGFSVGQPGQGKSLEQGAYAVFNAQTGIDLADPQAAQAYGVKSVGTQNLQDANYNPVPVLYVECSAQGLSGLVQAVQAKLQANAPADGVLQTAEAKRLSEAKNLIGPVLPPPDGWRNYLVQNYYGGKAPGQLNTEIDTLTTAIAACSGQLPTGFLIALDNVPKSGSTPTPPQPPQPSGTPVETYATVVNNNPYPIRIAATVANASDWASTANRPDKTLAGAEIAAFGSVTGRADLSSTAASAKVTLEVTADSKPETFAFGYDQKAALSTTKDATLGTFGQPQQYAINLSTDTGSQGKPTLTLAISENKEE
jgi:hypothetical protein